MAAGRKPKPTWLKLVSGNPGKRPLNVDEPQPVGDLASPPDWFSPEQRIEWDRALRAAPLGLLRSLDESMLVVWVCAKVAHADAVQKVATFGSVIKSGGQAQPSPYVGIMNKQATVMMRAAAEMGFSPSSRSRVSVKDQKPKSSPFADLKELPD